MALINRLMQLINQTINKSSQNTINNKLMQLFCRKSIRNRLMQIIIWKCNGLTTNANISEAQSHRDKRVRKKCQLHFTRLPSKSPAVLSFPVEARSTPIGRKHIRFACLGVIVHLPTAVHRHSLDDQSWNQDAMQCR